MDELTWVLADGATPGDLVAARLQMAISLGWHIVIACFGVGMPAFTLYMEWRALRSGEPGYESLARTWARGLGVLFAVGAVSGTILSFEMGLLWPGMMGAFGDVIGTPFALEGFAFFLEAIFLGIYLYTWDRLPPRLHLLTGIPIVVSGVASAFFVVSANAWMNQPRGFDLVNGEVSNVRPWAAMFNPATPPQTVHMIVAALMVAGFAIASVYAVGLLRGRRDSHHRLGFLIPFSVAAALSPVQVVVGDWAAHHLAVHQPLKLAAIEGLAESTPGAPLSLGGIYQDGQLRYALEIPNALSLLAHWNPDAVVLGLNEAPPDLQPPVTAVHLCFQLMVAIGFGLVLLGAWLAVSWWRHRDLPRTPWFLRLAVLAGPAAVIAVEAGWVVTEVGRQPWTVYGVMLTRDAVNPQPGLLTGLLLVLAVYLGLTVASIYVMRRLARLGPVSAKGVAPQERPEERPEEAGAGQERGS